MCCSTVFTLSLDHSRPRPFLHGDTVSDRPLKSESSYVLGWLEQVLIVYYSHSGHTKLLAEAIGAGARDGGTMVKIQPTNETSGADLLSADAIVIGSPTYFGSQASNFSAWIETTWTPFWQHGNLSTKKGAVFTTGGGFAQGIEHVLAELIRRLVHFKMEVIYPDQTFGAGYHSYGAIAVTGTPPWNETKGVAPVFLDAAADLGRTVSKRLAEDDAHQEL